MSSQRSGFSSPSSGDHYNGETARASCWSPSTWNMENNLGLRGEDASPRSDAPRDSVRPNEYARDKKPGLFVSHSASCDITKQRSRHKPQQPYVFAPRYASMLRAASASLDTTSVPCLSGLAPALPNMQPHPPWNFAFGHAYWN